MPRRADGDDAASAPTRDDAASSDGDAFARAMDDARCARTTTERTRCATTLDADGTPRRTCARERVVVRRCPGSAPETVERTRETIENDDADARAGVETSNAWSTSWSSSSSWGGAMDARGMDDGGVASAAARAFARALERAAFGDTDARDVDAIERGVFDAFIGGARTLATELSRAADALETRGDARDAGDDAPPRVPP